MEKSSKNLRLGDILVQNGLVSQEDLERALAYSKENGIRLGEALIHLGLMNPDAITWAMGHQMDLSFVELDRGMVDWDYLTTLPIDELREIRLLPLNRVHVTVTAVVADPTLPILAERIQELFPGMQMEVQLASETDILMILDEAVTMRTLSRSSDAVSLRGHRSIDRWISEWHQAIASGSIGGISILPDPQVPGEYQVLTPPDSGWQTIPSITDEEMVELSARVRNMATPLMKTAGQFHGFFPADTDGSTLPVRVLSLTALGHQALVLAGISDSPTERSAPKPPLVLFSDNPIAMPQRLRNFLLQGTAADTPSVYIAIQTDMYHGEQFHFEIPLAGDRGQLARTLEVMLSPDTIVVEINGVGELDELPSEAGAWPWTRLIVLHRGYTTKTPVVPEGWKAAFVDETDGSLTEVLAPYYSGA
ncbi:MAG: hypothetical protein JJU11_09330 [Candidatus Sumerlaeia bacterium]|nr:hypothetical protein [Candidatus Sumerlaeia bacterium]